MYLQRTVKLLGVPPPQLATEVLRISGASEKRVLTLHVGNLKIGPQIWLFPKTVSRGPLPWLWAGFGGLRQK